MYADDRHRLQPLDVRRCPTTPVTIIFPTPSFTLHPDNRNGPFLLSKKKGLRISKISKERHDLTVAEKVEGKTIKECMKRREN